MASKSTEEIKRRTLELYDTLPIDEEERKSHTEVRDEVFNLNQAFFGYIAKTTYVSNSSVTYEDKFQSACMHFMECWWWYKWPVRYRTDLSFSVFFKPRISEMVKRELNEVKCSVRRSLCMEAGEQLGKHWAKVTYDDLKDVDLPPNKMDSLKAIFGTSYLADIEDYTPYLESESQISTFEYPSEEFYTMEDFLIHEMCDQETLFTDKQLMKMADEYAFDYTELKAAKPSAEKKLYNMLNEAIDFDDIQS